MNKTMRLIIAIFCVAIITICTTLIINKKFGRTGMDLTEHGIYTLSDGTKNIIKKITQPITLKLYYSRESAMKGSEGIQYYNNYYLYVKDLLDEYKSIGNGKIKLQIIDPKPYSDEEDEAIQFGVKRFQISENDSFFFGLVAETQLGKSKTIEFFSQGRQQFVEYDISKLINRIISRDKKKVGVLSSVEIMAPEVSPYMAQMMQMQGKAMPKNWLAIQQLKEKYELKNIKVNDYKAINDKLDYLLVIQPKKLPETTLFAIDQFVMKGGRLIVFTDPYCLSDRPKPNPQNPYAAMSYDNSSNLNSLLEKWGVKMKDKMVAVDPTLAISPPGNPEPVLPFMQLTNNEVNKKEIITSTLQKIRVIFAGSLETVKQDGVKIIPLLTTSENGGTWQYKNPWELQRPDSRKIYQEMINGGKDTMLAALITGDLSSNYPNGIDFEKTEGEISAGKKKEAKPKKIHLKAIAKTSGDAMVIVVSDVDMISDMFAYQQTFFGMMAQAGDNVNFLFNALDFMSGSTDLISIRSRGNIGREFTAVKKIEQEADKATASEAEAINNKIKNYRQKLNNLGSYSSKNNEQLIEDKAMLERKKIEEEIRKANKAKRNLQAGKREKVENLKNYYSNINQFFASAIVLMIAILLSIYKMAKARKYNARRTR